LSWLRRLGYRLIRNPWVLFLFGAFWEGFVQMRFVKKDTPNNKSLKYQLNVHLTTLCLILLHTVIIVYCGLVFYFCVFLLSLWLAAVIGTVLFYMQHNFEESYFVREENWQNEAAALAGSSYFQLPKISKSSNPGYRSIVVNEPAGGTASNQIAEQENQSQSRQKRFWLGLQLALNTTALWVNSIAASVSDNEISPSMTATHYTIATIVLLVNSWMGFQKAELDHKEIVQQADMNTYQLWVFFCSSISGSAALVNELVFNLVDDEVLLWVEIIQHTTTFFVMLMSIFLFYKGYREEVPGQDDNASHRHHIINENKDYHVVNVSEDKYDTDHSQESQSQDSSDESDESENVPLISTTEKHSSANTNDSKEKDTNLNSSNGIKMGMFKQPTQLISLFYQQLTSKSDAKNFSYQPWRGKWGGRVYTFDEYEVKRDGDCGFHALGIDRETAVALLNNHCLQENVREALGEEISQEFNPGAPDGRGLSEVLSRDQHQRLSQLYLISRNWEIEMQKQAQLVRLMIQKESDRALSIPEIIQYLYTHHIENKDTKQLLSMHKSYQEAREKFKQACQDLVICRTYIEKGIGGTLWLGVHSAAILAKLKDISLYVWSPEKEGSKQLTYNPLSYHSPSSQGCVHLLHCTNYTHFNFLVEQPNNAHQHKLAESKQDIEITKKENDNAPMTQTLPTLFKSSSSPQAERKQEIKEDIQILKKENNNTSTIQTLPTLFKQSNPTQRKGKQPPPSKTKESNNNKLMKEDNMSKENQNLNSLLKKVVNEIEGTLNESNKINEVLAMNEQAFNNLIQEEICGVVTSSGYTNPLEINVILNNQAKIVSLARNNLNFLVQSQPSTIKSSSQ